MIEKGSEEVLYLNMQIIKSRDETGWVQTKVVREN